jgi:hypothetical protein
VIAGLGAVALFIASEMNNIIATRDKSILLIMPGLPILFALVTLILLGWRRYFTPSTILLFLLCVFILGIAVFDSISTRSFYNLIKSLNPDFSAGTGGGYVLELKVRRVLANTLGTLYILSIGTLVFFVADGAYRAWKAPIGREEALSNSDLAAVLVGGQDVDTTHILPWHYWVISVLALCWFGLGLASFVANLFLGTYWRETTETGLSPPAFPIWLLAPILAGSIGGFLGAVFLLFKNRNAVGCFLLCLLAALALLGNQIHLMRSNDMFSMYIFAMGVFSGVAVPAFLLLYTLKTLPRPSPN